MTEYECPFCPSLLPSFEKAEAHIQEEHPKKLDQAVQIFYNMIMKKSSILMPLSRITPDQLRLIKGNYEYVQSEGALRIPIRGNEWIQDLILREESKELQDIRWLQLG